MEPPYLDFTDGEEGLLNSVGRPCSYGSNIVLLDLGQLLGELIYTGHV